MTDQFILGDELFDNKQPLPDTIYDIIRFGFFRDNLNVKSGSSMKNVLRIATRKSRLALSQTLIIQEKIQTKYPNLSIQLVEITTQGDKILDKSLSKVGGKGLFVKELEQALIDKKADIAVHSLKDIPPDESPELILTAIHEREQPWDAFVSNRYSHVSQLPKHARVGTSSFRRQAQLLALRNDLSIGLLRGNVDTRLEKLDQGEFDAIILAAAGLIRLKKSERIQHVFTEEQMLPAAGQGAIAIQCRREDDSSIALLDFLNHPNTVACVAAERGLTAQLGGTCHTPIAAFAEIIDYQLKIKGRVLSPDGKQCVEGELIGLPQDATRLGASLGQTLLDEGARELLEILL